MGIDSKKKVNFNKQIIKKMKKIIGLLVLTLLFTNCKKTADELLFLEVNKFTGTYAGTWNSKKDNTSGKATVIIAADKSSRVVTMTIDFDGNFLNLGDLPAQTLSGTYSSANATLTGKNAVLGDYNITILKDGTVAGLMKNILGGVYPSMTLNGKVTEKNVDLASIITAKTGGTADVTLTLVK